VTLPTGQKPSIRLLGYWEDESSVVWLEILSEFQLSYTDGDQDKDVYISSQPVKVYFDFEAPWVELHRYDTDGVADISGMISGQLEPK
jgi:hypothetical protein